MKFENNRIKQIIERFNFSNVHKVMTFLNWTWRSSSRPPTIKDLKATALSLLADVESSKEKGYVSCSTGGFTASKVINSDSPFGYNLCLDFTIESWEE